MPPLASKVRSSLLGYLVEQRCSLLEDVTPSAMIMDWRRQSTEFLSRNGHYSDWQALAAGNSLPYLATWLCKLHQWKRIDNERRIQT